MTAPRLGRCGRLTTCAAVTLVATLAQAQPQDPSIEFVVARSDTLIGLSRDVLVSPAAWREVARLNRLRDPNRINPGQVLLIPQRLMRSAPAPARLTSVTGDVTVDGRVADIDSAVTEGQKIETAAGSSAVLAMADGSRLKLPPSSLAEVAASRSYGGRGADTGPGATGNNDGWFAGALRVLRGSVEVFATKVLRARPLEVMTPTAVVGVRGTQFRVGIDEAGKASTRSEVIEGVVRFDPNADRNAGVDLRAGFGALTEPGSAAPRVAKLLEAPDLTTVPARFERPLVRFTLPAQVDTVRVQVAQDAAFDRVVSDLRVPPGTDVRIAGLDDAAWFLRVRRVDAQGIEGFDSSRAFVLKARPEPPAYSAPRVNAKQSVGAVDFAWASNIAAPRAHLQVARDSGFSDLLLNRDDLTSPAVRLPIEAAGTYHWRLASIRADGDHGPFGDPQRFELRPLPEPPKGGPSPDGTTLVFAWGGRPEDRQQVQLARDAAFNEIVAAAELATPEWMLPRPDRGGQYFFRYRSVEPDGFVSPYSSTLSIELPRDWRPLLLLLPLLFAL